MQSKHQVILGVGVTSLLAMGLYCLVGSINCSAGENSLLTGTVSVSDTETHSIMETELLDSVVSSEKVTESLENQKLLFMLQTKQEAELEYTRMLEQTVTIERKKEELVAASYENDIKEELKKKAKENKKKKEAEEASRRVAEEKERQQLEEQKLLAEKQALADENDLSLDELLLCLGHDYNVPNEESGCKSEKKTFMSYQSVKSVSSYQYQLLNSPDCYTDPSTGIRMVGNRYCIAVGTGYCSTIGTKIDVVLEDGRIVKCILGDVKSDAHTDPTHRYHVGGMDNGQYYPGDGSVVEFIVDGSVFYSNGSGTVNSVTGLDCKVVKVIVVE